MSCPAIENSDDPRPSVIDDVQPGAVSTDVLSTPSAGPAPSGPFPRIVTDLGYTAVTFGLCAGQWAYDVACTIVTLGKTPIALLLLFYLSSILIRGALNTTISGLSPLCDFIPGLPFCEREVNVAYMVDTNGVSPTVRHIDFPSLMDLQARTVDRLLFQSTAGTRLGLSIKQAELAVKDLSTIVKASTLMSKEELAMSLDSFANEARLTSRGLLKLSSTIYSAVDSILAFNDYAARSVTSARLALGTTPQAGSDARVHHALKRAFETSLNGLSSHLARVLLETSRFIDGLDALEQRLSAVQAICERENYATAAAWSKLLSQFTTRLGGNQGQKFQLHHQLLVLQNVARYRSLAVAHVVATSEALSSIIADLSQLRERLSANVLRDELPIEVHLASIERATRRLCGERLKAGAWPPRSGHLLNDEVEGSSFVTGDMVEGGLFAGGVPDRIMYGQN
ncbi:hypothetical protein C8Q70DRAFT_1058346 [Cubamyces menziesii]|uniref:Uncharacterized protein n=1 Tax=Trametes cubensis TaxID=1111947 RepID=A0AAD7TW80_9APHY|nr:hypothetical protein C8Q70DRAFT_1058346 [Cubamyces menziesii]KAJ8487325.1 hypothetical protein ONZ51_g4242 [Trametes cubensis]